MTNLVARNQDYTYDLECYPNFFCIGLTYVPTGQYWYFEVSEWVNQGVELYQFLIQMSQMRLEMVGFNNQGYDYPVLHFLICRQGYVQCHELYAKSQQIISCDNRFAHVIKDRDQLVPQVDLYKMHHFDNSSKSTSLKVLEINMRMDDVRDLPYDPNYAVTYEQARELASYMQHDIAATTGFYRHSLPAINFRTELTAKYGKNFMNASDAKIGADIFEIKLNEAGIRTRDENWNPLQTWRAEIRIADIILPYIRFEHPEFNRILNFFRSQVMDPDNLKGFFTNVSATINGFQFDFGAGGIHGSLHKTVVHATDTHDLIDSDVASYYPNLGIKNRLYPAHLGEAFCDIYEGIYQERKSYPKSNPINGALKLALNGSYGNSNSKFSFLYDPQYTMTITINGQLSLCMLAEQLMKIPGLKMVQINTDGLTYLCPKEYREHAMAISAWWEGLTKLELEHADYAKMAIRDVNSYVAVTTSGKVKRIGAYAYVRAAEDAATREVPWHKDHSSLIIQKAAVAALVDNVPVEQTVRACTDPHDFVIKTKVPRSCKLELERPVFWGDQKVCSTVEVIQSTSRCYVSNRGGALTKVMPPTPGQVEHYATGDHYRHRNNGAYKVVKPGAKPPSGMYELVVNPDLTPPDRRIGIGAGWAMKECNSMQSFDWSDLNYDYYIAEARKLVDPLLS